MADQGGWNVVSSTPLKAEAPAQAAGGWNVVSSVPDEPAQPTQPIAAPVPNASGLVSPDEAMAAATQGANELASHVLGTGQTIGATKPSFLQRLIAPFTGPGSAYGNVNAQRTGEQIPYNPDAPLIDFGANADKITGGKINKGFTQGAQDTLSGFTTPKSIAIILATGGLGAEGKLTGLSEQATGRLAEAGAKWMPRIRALVSGGFSLDMIYGALKQSPVLISQIKKGDTEGAVRTLTGMAAGLGMGTAAGLHAKTELTSAPKPVTPPATANSTGAEPYAPVQPTVQTPVQPVAPPVAAAPVVSAPDVSAEPVKAPRKPKTKSPAAPVAEPAQPVAAPAAPVEGWNVVKSEPLPKEKTHETQTTVTARVPATGAHGESAGSVGEPEAKAEGGEKPVEKSVLKPEQTAVTAAPVETKTLPAETKAPKAETPIEQMSGYELAELAGKLGINTDKFVMAETARSQDRERAALEKSVNEARQTPLPKVEPMVPAEEGERAGQFKMSRLKKGQPGISQEADPLMGAQSRMTVFVSRDANGEPQGYLHFYLDDAKQGVAPPDHGLSPEVYVNPAARRKGVASGLYDAAKKAGYDLSKVSGRETTPAGAAFLNARNAPAETPSPKAETPAAAQPAQPVAAGVAGPALTDPEMEYQATKQAGELKAANRDDADDFIAVHSKHNKWGPGDADKAWELYAEHYRRGDRESVLRAAVSEPEFRKLFQQRVGGEQVFTPQQQAQRDHGRDTQAWTQARLDGEIGWDVPFAEWRADPRRGAASLDLLTLGVNKFVSEDVAPVLKDVAAGMRDTVGDIAKTLVPTLYDRNGKTASLILRGKLGELARKTDQAQFSVRQAEKYFNRQPAADNFDFIDRMENGQKQKTADLDTVAGVLRQLYDSRRAAVQALGTGKLRNFYENYFAHIWAKPDRAKTVFAAFFGKRPLEGPKAFLKKRTYPTIADGLAAGLKPITENPVTMTLMKIREMDKYIMAHEALKDLDAKYVDAREGQPPAGWQKIEDAIGTVYGQSIQQIAEYPNEGIYTGLEKAAAALGVNHTRGFLKMGDAIGRAYRGTGEVKTVHGSKEGTLAHEIGHQIDWLAGSGKRFVLEYPDAATVARLGAAYATVKDKASAPAARTAAYAELRALKGAIADRKEFQKQLRDLADLRDGPQSYVRKREEKMAQLAQMWVEGRGLFERTAPKVFAEWKKFLDENPKLHPLRDIEASANATMLSQPYDVGGLVIKGHWYLPDGAARVLDNYLSPGLNRYAPFRAAMGLNNVMNLFNLGLSGFHLTKTGLEATISKAGTGFEDLARGHPIDAAKNIFAAPAAPFTAWVKGSKMLREWYTPGSQGSVIGKLMDDLTSGGARARLDQMYRTTIAENMVRAFHKGNLPGAAIRVPFAAMEGLTRLIMDEVVPRLKLGTMADMAAADLDRLGPNATFDDVQRVMAETVNSVDNRMGEVARDNFFTHRYVKDLSMFLMRADQYTLGTVREIGGAAVDLVRQPVNVMRGDPVNLKRLSYVASMLMVHMAYSALYQYLHTGKWPEEGEDYFYPKNGQTDENGHPQRTSLMSYVKDVHSFARHPVRTIENKVAPTIALVSALIRNRDFWNTEITSADDPPLAKAGEAGKFVVKQFEPRSVENALRQKKLGASIGEQAEQFVGLSPAPSDLNQSPAERIAREISASHASGEPRTAEAAARSELRQSLTRSLHQGKGVPADVKAARRAGTFSNRDWNEAVRAAKEDPLQRAFLRMGIRDACKVYTAATPEEKKWLQPMLARKAKAAHAAESRAEWKKTLELYRAAIAK